MKIGIIGGNGVAATNRLLDMVERKVTLNGGYRDAHHPELLVAYDTQSPSRSMYLEGRGESFVPGYIALAKMFKKEGCGMVCMCCNTAHYAISEIENKSGVRFINLLTCVAQKICNEQLDNVELWVTDGARKFDIYGEAFKKYAPNCEVLYPSLERQSRITELICSVKSQKRFLPKDHPQSPYCIMQHLIRNSQAPIILGCTDLRIAYGNDDPLDKNIVLDSLECLADAIVKFSSVPVK